MCLEKCNNQDSIRSIALFSSRVNFLSESVTGLEVYQIGLFVVLLSFYVTPAGSDAPGIAHYCIIGFVVYYLFCLI